MNTLNNGRTAPKSKQYRNRQPMLEKIFNAVDLIKSDLTTCGKGLNKEKTSDAEIFKCEEHSFQTSYLKNGKKIRVSYLYDADLHIITRQINKEKVKTLLENVTDFFIAFFSDSNSVLYRIETNGKEQVRGYIFLSSMIKEETND